MSTRKKLRLKIEQRQLKIDWSLVISSLSVFLALGSGVFAYRANQIAERSASPSIVVVPRINPARPILVGCVLDGQHQLWASIRYLVRFTNLGGQSTSLVGYHILENQIGGRIDKSINLPFGWWEIYEGAWPKIGTTGSLDEFVYFPKTIPPGESAEWDFETRKILAASDALEAVTFLVPKANAAMPTAITWQFHFGSGENRDAVLSLTSSVDDSSLNFNKRCKQTTESYLRGER